MDVRIIIFVLVFCYYLVLGKKRNTVRSKNKLVFFSCVLLVLYSGLRHISVGPDTDYYYQHFTNIHNQSWSSILSLFSVDSADYRDPGYSLFVKIFSTILPYWQIYLLGLAIFYYYAMGRLWKRYILSSEGVLLAVVLVLSLFAIISLSGIRQQITMAISMYLIPYVDEKKWKVVLPVAFLGTLIHISLLFFFAFIPFQYIRKGNYRFFIGLSILMIPIIAFSANAIVEFMAMQLDNEYYMGYAEDSSSGGAYVYLIACSLISIFLFTNYGQLKKAPSFFSSALVLMTISVPLIMKEGTMIRIGQYFTIYMMLSLPWVIDAKIEKQFFYCIMVIPLLLYILQSTSHYYFYWENVPGIMY